jgi:hypothetical protein
MGLRLSEQHGVNPSVEQCFVCMKDVGVVLFGQMKGDAEAPRKVCLGPDSEPCDECKGHMEMGIILISVDESKTTDEKNPWRSGGWVVVKEDMIRRMFNPPELVEQVLKKRVAFMPDEAWDMIGLPRGGDDGPEREPEGTAQTS